jgi:hypothetical protein
MLCAEAALQGFPLWGHVPGSSSGSCWEHALLFKTQRPAAHVKSERGR